MVIKARSASLDHAERVADSLRRSIRHAESEYIVPFSPETVMATVSSDASLVRSDSLAWVVPKFGEDGKLSLEIASDRDGVTKHYTWVQEAGERDRYDLNARLATDWWVIWDSQWKGVSPFTRERVETEAFSLHFTDGDGISGEMTSLGLTPPLRQTHAERVQLFKDYFTAVESNNVDQILRLFTEEHYVGSAVRRYFGGMRHELAVLPNLSDLRLHYEEFHQAASVTEAIVTNWYIKDWYLFAEVLWRLKLRDGSRMRMSTAEVMLLGPDGRLAGRLGHGTRLEPLSNG
ncbi:hypothetical protein [Nonomuraea lactucae]|uniref:hypothetical protein n=1 Tax=Nonomuraea lactucae TaxID=2249762 RepID=UPI000DE314FF|nr:hypothetical protein [Nonomuraea lactucae]